VAVRAKSLDQPTPTELTLTESSVSGEPIRINTNRRYLARALNLGFREVYVFSPKTPVSCRDGRRQFAWALLNPESAIPPTTDVVRIESPRSEGHLRKDKSQPRKRKAKMTRSSPSQTHAAKSNGDGVATNGKAKAGARVNCKSTAS
jgi:hypothetical protein